MNNLRKKRTKKNGNPRRNRQIVGASILGVTVAVFLIFIGRFFYLIAVGEVDNKNLSIKASELYQKSQILRAKRGTIFDAVGNPIAEDSSTYSVYAVLDKSYVGLNKKKLYVQDKEKTAKILAKYLPLTEEKIFKALNPTNTETYQVEFGNAGKNLSLAIKNEINNEKLPGIEFYETPSRLYPNGVFASHIVGLAQLDTDKSKKSTSSDSKSLEDKLVGVMGIEKEFNRQLTGVSGKKVSQQDSASNDLPNTESKITMPKDGSDVYLTIDSRLQTYLESLMTEVNNKYAPVGMNAILMNAKTGEILAATQRPTFDAATKDGIGQMWRDTLIEDVYEPGSVMKVATLSAAINSGNYNPNEYYQSGAVTIGSNTIRDWNVSGWGSIPFSQGFPRSSNVAMVKLEQKMGSSVWQTYLNKFGFGQKTGIELPGEAAGSIQYDQPLDQAITSFGQGVNVNAIQMMQMFSTVANGGKMIQPRIVSKIVNPNTKKTTIYKTKVVGQPVSASTAQSVLKSMEDVVYQSYGTGTAYQIPGYKIAAKTGTAQIASENGGGYLTGSKNYIFSVAGVAPADNPKYILYITMKQPQKMTDAAETILASVFKPFMKRALEYNKTSTTISSTQIKMPGLTGKSVTEAKKALMDSGLKPIIIGTGNTVVQQNPNNHDIVYDGQNVMILTNGAMTLPSLSGWSKNDVLKLAVLTGVDIKIKGSGYVTAQSLPAGSPVDGQSKINVTLKEPTK